MHTPGIRPPAQSYAVRSTVACTERQDDLSIPELIETAKRRDGYTDDDIGAILGRKGSMVQRYRTGKIPLPTSLYEVAAAWIGCDVAELRAAAAIEREDEAKALLAAAEALGSAGRQMEKNLRQASQLVKRLTELDLERSKSQRKPGAGSQQPQSTR